MDNSSDLTIRIIVSSIFTAYVGSTYVLPTLVGSTFFKESNIPRMKYT